MRSHAGPAPTAFNGRRHPIPHVLVLTTFDLDEYVCDGLRAGASGFLLKDAPEDHLVSSIRVIAEGGSLLTPP
jgi:DNA-binding NarL/FixJ family response regulator